MSAKHDRQGGEDGNSQNQTEETGNGDSVSRPTTPPQPAVPPGNPLVAAENPTVHVVLYQPEIPQNTGNIGRTCVAVDAKLWIVRPAAFQLDEKRLRRAGLDYWKYLDFEDVANWETLTNRLTGHRWFFFSRFAKRTIWQASFQPGDVLVFGRETSGLPSSILRPDDPRSLRLPTNDKVRSLNLATTVGIALYEHQRQTLTASRSAHAPS